MTASPLKKVLLGLLLTAVLGGLSRVESPSIEGVARGLLALTGLAAIGCFWWRRHQGRSAHRPQEPLRALQRLGLSPRATLTLVEEGGRRWMVVHGDGFARIVRCRAPRAEASFGKRPARAPQSVGLAHLPARGASA